MGIIPHILRKRLIEAELDISGVMRMPFISHIKKNGGEVVIVGGAVRDELLKKTNKDFDLMVRNIPMDVLVTILEPHGDVDVVGKSFGVIKFNPKGMGLEEPIDIAVPRTERMMSDKEKEEYKTKHGKSPTDYQAFVVSPDHKMDFKGDLMRRDFTINAIAKREDGTIYDPYNGLNDLKNGIIRMVSPKSFIDDPLRMLRAVQFASRFNFNIEDETLKSIQQNASKINGISGERILIELKKIVDKGSVELGVKWLIKTNLYEYIFESKPQEKLMWMFKGKLKLSEFMFSTISGKNKSKIFKQKFKGDLDTAKQIEAMEYIWDNHYKVNDNKDALVLCFNMYKITPYSFELTLLPNIIKENVSKMKNGAYPKTITELDINGNEIMGLGFKGKDVGAILNNILLSIYSDNLKNNKEDIIEFIKNA